MNSYEVLIKVKGHMETRLIDTNDLLSVFREKKHWQVIAYHRVVWC
jgi:hypothetical protein